MSDKQKKALIKIKTAKSQKKILNCFAKEEPQDNLV